MIEEVVIHTLQTNNLHTLKFFLCFSTHFLQPNFHALKILHFFIFYFFAYPFLLFVLQNINPQGSFPTTTLLFHSMLHYIVKLHIPFLKLHLVLLPFYDYNWVKLNLMYAYFLFFLVFLHLHLVACVLSQDRGGRAGHFFLIYKRHD